MKKILGLLISSAILINLFACGNYSQESSDYSSAPSNSTSFNTASDSFQDTSTPYSQRKWENENFILEDKSYRIELPEGVSISSNNQLYADGSFSIPEGLYGTYFDEYSIDGYVHMGSVFIEATDNYKKEENGYFLKDDFSENFYPYSEKIESGTCIESENYLMFTSFPEENGKPWWITFLSKDDNVSLTIRTFSLNEEEIDFLTKIFLSIKSI